MLRGERVALRARAEADVPILHRELHDDVETRSRTDVGPWRPVPVSESPYTPAAASPDTARFSIVDLATDALAGSALVWGIDSHNRLAHLGMALLPAFRGRGLAVDLLRVLCDYGFVTLGLHRLQLETLADNTPMIRAAERAGFSHEATLRENAWVAGRFLDEIILGRLAP